MHITVFFWLGHNTITCFEDTFLVIINNVKYFVIVIYYINTLTALITARRKNALHDHS